MDAIIESEKVKNTAVGNLVTKACVALSDEIEEAQKDPSRSFEVFEGRLLHESDDGHLYTFKADMYFPFLQRLQFA